MKFKNFIALTIAVVIMLTVTACGNNSKDGTDKDTTAAVEETIAEIDNVTLPVDGPTSSTERNRQPDNDSVDTPNVATSNAGTVPNNPANVKKGLNSTDTKTVLDFYKAAAKNTEYIDAEQHMSIASIDFTPKNSFEKGLLSFFRSISSAALSAHSTPRTDVPGDHQQLQTSDLNSANALVSEDYTIVTLNVKSQEDNKDIKDGSRGPVGHAVGTIGDMNQVFDAIPSIEVDHSQGDIILRYDNCKVVVKINNRTGKIETGIWSYTVNVTLTDIYARFPESEEQLLTDMSGSVSFYVKTKDQK